MKDELTTDSIIIGKEDCFKSYSIEKQDFTIKLLVGKNGCIFKTIAHNQNEQNFGISKDGLKVLLKLLKTAGLFIE